MKRLEVEIVKRGAWDLYTQLEGSAFRKTVAGVPDTRPPWLKNAEDRLETWLERRLKRSERLKRFLQVAPTVLFMLSPLLLLGCVAVLATESLYAGAAEPVPAWDFSPSGQLSLGHTHASILANAGTYARTTGNGQVAFTPLKEETKMSNTNSTVKVTEGDEVTP